MPRKRRTTPTTPLANGPRKLRVFRATADLPRFGIVAGEVIAWDPTHGGVVTVTRISLATVDDVFDALEHGALEPHPQTQWTNDADLARPRLVP